jgi:hypothetical protein
VGLSRKVNSTVEKKPEIGKGPKKAVQSGSRQLDEIVS